MTPLTEVTEFHEDNERDDLEFLDTSSFGHDTENFYSESEYDSGGEGNDNYILATMIQARVYL